MQHRCMKMLIRNGTIALYSKQKTTEQARDVFQYSQQHSYLTESTQPVACFTSSVEFALILVVFRILYRVSNTGLSIQLNSVLVSN